MKSNYLTELRLKIVGMSQDGHCINKLRSAMENDQFAFTELLDLMLAHAIQNYTINSTLESEDINEIDDQGLNDLRYANKQILRAIEALKNS